MSAETTLRRAAALMRERAEAVPSGPWRAGVFKGGNRDQRRVLGTYSMVHDAKSEVALVRGFSSERESTATHIASWHPTVALAVADLLDYLAPLADGPWGPDSTIDRAVRIAETYLGSES